MKIKPYKNIGYEIPYIIASVIFLAQSCSVAPSMRESARSYDWATYTNFSWQSKIDSAISSYPLLLYPSYEAKGSAGFTVPLFYHMDKKSGQILK